MFVNIKLLSSVNYDCAYQVRMLSFGKLRSPRFHKKDAKHDDKFIHDYSVLPYMIQYRVPTDSELKAGPQPYANPIKFIFEKGGVESFDWSENRLRFNRFPLIDSNVLAKRSKRPRNVKILTSDFIEDSLYNPNYGYFSREVVIFQPGKPFNYPELKDREDFMNQWLHAYKKYDDRKRATFSQGKRKDSTDKIRMSSQSKKITGSENSTSLENPSLQLWHTPTELFQPYYGQALAKYILANYKMNSFPYGDLIIYEVGAGNGTLMLNVLDYLEQHEPEVYRRTKYKIIEISTKLFVKQHSRITRHMDKVEVKNKNVLDWDEVVDEPCFVIALEVFDNLSHDVIRYDISDNKPYQGYVLIDEHNDFREFYSPELEPFTAKFLRCRENSDTPISQIPDHPVNQLKFVKKLKNTFDPLRNGLSDPEYVPTRLYKFFEILKTYFPNHQLLASDFSSLDKSIKGYNAPVVQTMLRNNMVNTDSYMCDQGFFDIMFPTDFEVMSSIYKEVTGKVCNTCTHEDFLRTWGDVDATTTKSGENPMLELYSNASFIYS